MSLAQTAKAVAISAQASILGRAVAQSARDSGMDASQAEGISNAVRHAFWQMSLSRELGTDIAEQIGNIHEEGSDAPGTPLGLQRDSWVDQFNNERARQAYEQCIADGVCSDEELAAILAALLANGELITDKDCDSRIPATLRDCNGNGVPDGNECIPNPDQNNQVRADVNRDGVVNQSDALIVLDDLGTFNASTDQTGDCFVWVDDFDAVLDEMSE